MLIKILCLVPIIGENYRYFQLKINPSANLVQIKQNFASNQSFTILPCGVKTVDRKREKQIARRKICFPTFRLWSTFVHTLFFFNFFFCFLVSEKISVTEPQTRFHYQFCVKVVHSLPLTFTCRVRISSGACLSLYAIFARQEKLIVFVFVL